MNSDDIVQKVKDLTKQYKESGEQKPIHIVKHDLVQDIKDLNLQIAEGQKQAEAKAEHVSTLFPPGMEHFITAETEDGETKYYLNFKLEF